MSIKNSLKLAKKIRIHGLNMTNVGKSSHISSIFSIADILAVLYDSILKYDAKNPKLPERDRFILSKGHAAAALYAVLAESGFFSLEKLKTYYLNGSDLLGHATHGVQGVEFSSGSLGHGLPVSNGIALAASINKNQYKVFVLMSDGEFDEGSNWEAMLFAAHHNLDNLVMIIDRNKLQSIKSTEQTLALEPLKKKIESFGWIVKEIDGHNHEELCENLNKKFPKRPLCIIANTIKGKGVSFMENNVLWHYRSPQNKEFEDALDELNA